MKLKKFDLPITIGASRKQMDCKALTDCVKPFGVIALPQEKVYDYTKRYRC